MQQLRMTTTRMLVLAAALAGASGAQAETRCESRPAVGGGTLTVCREAGTSAPAQEYLTRPAVGGGTITTGAGRTCSTRPAVGGGVVTSCR
jgi:hypothetical protein